MIKLIEDSWIIENSTLTLFHPDLHKHNIFVAEDDPLRMTAFIDWQSIAIEPAFYYADETPDFAAAVSEKLEDDTMPGYDEDTSAYMAYLCNQAFELSVHALTPRIASARNLDEDLVRPLRYCRRTWKDGVVALDMNSWSCRNVGEIWDSLNRALAHYRL